MPGLSPTRVLLITPPLTQLNTAYPATAYLKGFLSRHRCEVRQADLGIELILAVFSRSGLIRLFAEIDEQPRRRSVSQRDLLKRKKAYLSTIDPVIRFLQDKDPQCAHRICQEGFLPEGQRFRHLPDLDEAFGVLGVQERARFLSTLYLEDLADLIRERIDPGFGLSRYGERLALSATSFRPLVKALRNPGTLIDVMMIENLERHLQAFRPDLIGFSVPFPGCLYGALRCSCHVRSILPQVPIVFGGGYPSTELRQPSSPEMFRYVDYLVMDDGALPLLQIIRHHRGEIPAARLKRTFRFQRDGSAWIDDPDTPEMAFAETGFPDYSDLTPGHYLTLLERLNPMFRLWSEGWWNQLTLAYGCYWHRCAFCDSTLDYIRRYEPLPAGLAVDRIEAIVDSTGRSGFHFVDEAAAPDRLADLALELLRRDVSITWWTNIRFEKRFTKGLCRLLAASGCIGVTAGLEVPVDRLLKRMRKGITVRQAAQVADNLQEAGIMVHTYLMYGFPTQTEQETIDALETVRQFFANGLVQSGYWHRFSLTTHSFIGQNPDRFQLRITGPPPGDFAFNDLSFEETAGMDHDRYGPGLNKALYNYMHGVGLELTTDSWFSFPTPKTTLPVDYVTTLLTSIDQGRKASQQRRLVWIGNTPNLTPLDPAKSSGRSSDCRLVFYEKSGNVIISTNLKTARWIQKELQRCTADHTQAVTIEEWAIRYRQQIGSDFSRFRNSRIWQQLEEIGLLILPSVAEKRTGNTPIVPPSPA